MSFLRSTALQELMNRQNPAPLTEARKTSEYFGVNVFGRDAMREFLAEEAFNAVQNAITYGTQIDRAVADLVAAGMKAWALSKNASHYTHWFQPLTGATAEKHDAFFTPLEGGKAIEKFEGGQLVQQEPDASSFPNGGIRNTFEARGYTAWDPTSPAFIINATLCIPTIFVSYTGEALDYKTPLLNAHAVLDKAAVDVCQYFDKNVTKVIATLGWEQEYFLVDLGLYHARPDLMMCGRTLFGDSPAKGQQLEDHYFGSIPDRVSAFMQDLETEAWKLGIPVKTRHNEVAPGQFELAPVFEEMNLAIDHNQLIMDLMDKIARRHRLKVLMHEKPFAGVNGSGKHNNWSLATNTGKNLLSPGKTPKTNLQFLTFFVNTIKAVHAHADLLRAAIASAGNDHRLGANEAPPAIISVFLGTQLSQVLDDVEKKVKEGKMSPEAKTDVKLNIGKIPQIILDNTDRNRTSPFAFTGNKFEFRAVGSSANCSASMMVLNTIVANQLIEFKKDVDTLIAKKKYDKEEAILHILRDYIVTSKNIRFEGNGYGDEWVKEAAKRGLSNFKTTPPALDAYVSKESKKLFTSLKVISERELEARYEISLEQYVKAINIESLVIEDLVLNQILPVAVAYQTDLLSNVTGMLDVFGDSKGQKLAATQIQLIEKMAGHINTVKENIDAMAKARTKTDGLSDAHKQAAAYNEKVKPYFDVIRTNVDELELIVDDSIWPLPKYREMLFLR